MEIDVTFDFRGDAGGGDPDRYSPSLRRCHQLLWSKPLPDGTVFELSDATPGVYLHHRSGLGEFRLASDSVMQTFTRWESMKPITEQVATSMNDDFQRITYTIGGMMVFPGNPIEGRWTINQARGCTRSIADRFDLTLECIRRHYAGETSPLAGPLGRYAAFFALFGDFAGYVEFFLLDDLVSAGTDGVKFFTSFDDFRSPATPADVPTYLEFRRRSIEFVEARNVRIHRLGL